MEWIGLVLRTLGMYCIIFIVLRLMGKREIGKLSVLDLVISVMIAEIAVIEIEMPEGEIGHGLVPIVALVIAQIITAFVSLKNRKIRLVLDGKPSIIIANGKIMKDELKKQRYNLDDLMLQLRENSITSVSEVEFAILETSGKLSIIPKAEESSSSNAAKQTSQTQPSIIPSGFRYDTLPIPLIMDGIVQDDNLEKIKQTRFWLKNIIQEKGAQHFKEVLLCTIDHKNRIYVDIGNKKN